VPSYRAGSAAAASDYALDLDRSVVGAFLARLTAPVSRLGSALWRAALRRPFDSLGVAAAVVATGAILTNALFLQPTPHPAPMLAGKPRPVASGDDTGSVVLPRPRPGEGGAAKADAAQPARARTQVVSDIQRELAQRGYFDGPVDGIYGPKTDTAIRDFEQVAGLKGNSQPDAALLDAIVRSAVKPPPAPAAPPAPPVARPAGVPRPAQAAKGAAPSKRILAVQRALTDFGYGQVIPNGVLGATTRTAIERFERERKLPVTGQVSERLTRELAAVTGRPLE
jgi:peptidoglycan hydrolase-like protein with peptidoglycan-binding domain